MELGLKLPAGWTGFTCDHSRSRRVSYPVTGGVERVGAGDTMGEVAVHTRGVGVKNLDLVG